MRSTDEKTPAKTVLAFMIQSIFGKFEDAVRLIPINKLDANLLKTWFYKVMESMDVIFHVMAISAMAMFVTGKL